MEGRHRPIPGLSIGFLPSDLDSIAKYGRELLNNTSKRIKPIYRQLGMKL